MSDYLSELVAELDTERVRLGALRLLAEVGMSVPALAVERRVEEAGLRTQGHRVYFDQQAVAEFLDRQKAQAEPEAPDAPLGLHTGSHCLYECAPENHALRRLTIGRLEQWTRLVGALEKAGILASAYCPGIPADCPPVIAPLWQNVIAARHIKRPPIISYSTALVPYTKEIYRIIGRKPDMALSVHPVSPLVLGGEELELALLLLDQGLATSCGAAPMPVMGVSAPLDWEAAWAQALAEAAGTALALEAMGYERVTARACLYAADMRHGTFVYGSPEHVLLTLSEAKVNREILGLGRREAKALNTTAKTPGPQAAAEKSAHALAALLGGYRELGGMGILAVTRSSAPSSSCWTWISRSMRRGSGAASRRSTARGISSRWSRRAWWRDPS